MVPVSGIGRFVTLFSAELDKLSAELYNGYMSLDDMMLREEIARAIEAIPIQDSITNALGMRMLAAEAARGSNSMFESQVDFE